GDINLDDLSFVRVGRWEGDLWAGRAKGAAGVFIDERADERQAEVLPLIFGGRAGAKIAHGIVFSKTAGASCHRAPAAWLCCELRNSAKKQQRAGMFVGPRPAAIDKFPRRISEICSRGRTESCWWRISRYRLDLRYRRAGRGRYRTRSGWCRWH